MSTLERRECRPELLPPFSVPDGDDSYRLEEPLGAHVLERGIIFDPVLKLHQLAR
jgi:hypothetical protein